MKYLLLVVGLGLSLTSFATPSYKVTVNGMVFLAKSWSNKSTNTEQVIDISTSAMVCMKVLVI